jgi:hypothetical protein
MFSTVSISSLGPAPLTDSFPGGVKAVGGVKLSTLLYLVGRFRILAPNFYSPSFFMARGSVVVKTPCFKPEGRGFET